MARSGLRRAPSSYNTPLYNMVQLGLFVSSTIVAGITLFFIWNLKHDGWPLPWTFIVTAVMSFLTTCAIFLRSLFRFCHTPNPTHQLLVSAAVLIGWLLAFALLSWNARVTLMTACDSARWGPEGRGGQLVCRLYKAQYAFAVFALLTAIATFALDFSARQRLLRHGAYNRMDDQHGGTWNTKDQAPHDDPWSVDGATELHDYGNSQGSAGKRREYQPLDRTQQNLSGDYTDLNGHSGTSTGYGHDTEYRGRGHIR